MFCQRLALLGQIEEVRKELHSVAMNKHLTDHRVVEVSQKLDLLLNQYYALTNMTLTAKRLVS